VIDIHFLQDEIGVIDHGHGPSRRLHAVHDVEIGDAIGAELGGGDGRLLRHPVANDNAIGRPVVEDQRRRPTAHAAQPHAIRSQPQSAAETKYPGRDFHDAPAHLLAGLDRPLHCGGIVGRRCGSAIIDDRIYPAEPGNSHLRPGGGIVGE
jgi:hypothetical protein